MRVDGHHVLGRHSRNTAPMQAVSVVLQTPPLPETTPTTRTACGCGGGSVPAILGNAARPVIRRDVRLKRCGHIETCASPNPVEFCAGVTYRRCAVFPTRVGAAEARDPPAVWRLPACSGELVPGFHGFVTLPMLTSVRNRSLTRLAIRHHASWREVARIIRLTAAVMFARVHGARNHPLFARRTVRARQTIRPQGCR